MHDVALSVNTWTARLGVCQVNVGGLSTGPARPLTGELKTFADSAVNGLIVVAFGSLDIGSDRFFDEFFAAFAQLSEFHIVWR